MTSPNTLAAAMLIACQCLLFVHQGWGQNEANPQPQSGQGWLVKMDEQMFPPPGASGQHFHQARAEMLNGSVASAKEEIRKGATYLMAELGRATDAGKRLLEASIRDLSHLAEVMGKSETNYYDLQNTGFEQIFGKSELGLARHHQLVAARSWEQKKTEATGRHLDAAGIHLKHAWAWLRDGLDAAREQATKETERAGLVLTREQLIEADGTAAALVKGTGWTEAGVESALANFDKEIAALDKAVANEEKAPETQPAGKAASTRSVQP